MRSVLTLVVAVLLGGLLPVSATAEPASREPRPVTSAAATHRAPTWWRPTPDTPISWHWQLSGRFRVPRDVRPGVYVYDVDGETTKKRDITRLKRWGAAHGQQVVAICYIDVGVYESYRGDKHRFAKAQRRLRARTGNPQARLWGNEDQGWADSWWLDVRQRDLLRPIMRHRIQDWCVRKGFDAVEPDETEVWDNDPGFPISRKQSHRYTRMIARIAHRNGLSVGLKGNTGEAKALEPYHDWALAEECFQYDECGRLVTSFVRAGKAVFDVEYARRPDCRYADAHRINAVRRDLDLVGPHRNGYRYRPCRPDGATTWH